MEEGTLRALRELAPWHLDVELCGGVRTAQGNAATYGDDTLEQVGVVDPRELWDGVLRHVYPRGLEGRTFLDVGCNAGGYCFVARAAGAGRTLGFDVRDRWIRQAEFIRKHWDGDTRDMDFRVAHIDELDFGDGFDITLFKGVFYHLPDPIHALAKLCAATRELIIIDTASHSGVPENAIVSNQESTTHVMSGVDGLAWLPGGPRAVADIAAWAGFPAHRVVYWQKEVPGSPPGWGRFRVVAAREAGLLAVG